MKMVFSPEGVKRLRMALVLLVLSVLAAIGIAVGSNLYVERERRESMSSERRLQEWRGKVDSARRERDSQQESADVYRTLVERGFLAGEKRLDLVEMVNALRARHQLFSLDYEISAQRPLQLSGNRVFPSIDVLASRVRMRMRALHEGDVLAFVEALAQARQGFYPLHRCNLRRVEAPADTVQPRVEAECAFEWITLKEKNANRPG
jgi:hypothetical protein